jgi:hypothetical protein
LKLPKSDAGRRTIPLFPGAAAALQALAARVVERGFYAPDELVFATAKGTPLHDSNLRRRVWDKALEKARLSEHRYRIHDLPPHVREPPRSGGGRRQACPGDRGAFRCPHHAEALLAPARRPDHGDGDPLRPGDAVTEVGTWFAPLSSKSDTKTRNPLPSRDSLLERTGIEPVTSGLQSRRSPS